MKLKDVFGPERRKKAQEALFEFASREIHATFDGCYATIPNFDSVLDIHNLSLTEYQNGIALTGRFASRIFNFDQDERNTLIGDAIKDIKLLRQSLKDLNYYFISRKNGTLQKYRQANNLVLTHATHISEFLSRYGKMKAFYPLVPEITLSTKHPTENEYFSLCEIFLEIEKVMISNYFENKKYLEEKARKPEFGTVVDPMMKLHYLLMKLSNVINRLDELNQSYTTNEVHFHDFKGSKNRDTVKRNTYALFVNHQIGVNYKNIILEKGIRKVVGKGKKERKLIYFNEFSRLYVQELTIIYKSIKNRQLTDAEVQKLSELRAAYGLNNVLSYINDDLNFANSLRKNIFRFDGEDIRYVYECLGELADNSRQKERVMQVIEEALPTLNKQVVNNKQSVELNFSESRKEEKFDLKKITFIQASNTVRIEVQILQDFTLFYDCNVETHSLSINRNSGLQPKLQKFSIDNIKLLFSKQDNFESQILNVITQSLQKWLTDNAIDIDRPQFTGIPLEPDMENATPVMPRLRTDYSDNISPQNEIDEDNNDENKNQPYIIRRILFTNSFIDLWVARGLDRSVAKAVYEELVSLHKFENAEKLSKLFYAVDAGYKSSFKNKSLAKICDSVLKISVLGRSYRIFLTKSHTESGRVVYTIVDRPYSHEESERIVYGKKF